MSLKKIQQKKGGRGDDDKKRGGGFEMVGSLFDNYQVGDSGKYISREFQDFGYRLAVKLNDLEHKGLYMKLAKEEDRWLLEKALRFVSDAQNVKSKGRLFMWKIKQLKKDKKQD